MEPYPRPISKFEHKFQGVHPCYNDFLLALLTYWVTKAHRIDQNCCVKIVKTKWIMYRKSVGRKFGAKKALRDPVMSSQITSASPDFIRCFVPSSRSFSSFLSAYMRNNIHKDIKKISRLVFIRSSWPSGLVASNFYCLSDYWGNIGGWHASKKGPAIDEKIDCSRPDPVSSISLSRLSLLEWWNTA